MTYYRFSIIDRIKLRWIRKHTNKLRVMSHKLLSECVSDIKKKYDKFLKKFEEVREDLLKFSKN